MRSESTSALGQPRLTKPTLGLLRLTDFTLFRGVAGRPRIVLQSPFVCLFAADKRGVRAIPGPNSADSHCQIPVAKIATQRKQNPLKEDRRRLKNPTAGPIKTLNVHRSAQVGEVNTEGLRG